jgi:hypothetical protein
MDFPTNCLAGSAFPEKIANLQRQRNLEFCRLAVLNHYFPSARRTNTTRPCTAVGAATRSDSQVSNLTMVEHLENVHNARDFATASSKVAQGRIFRAGNPAHGTLNDVLLLREKLDVRQMVDFRSSDEHAEDKGWSLMLSNGTIKKYDADGNLTEVALDHHEDLQGVRLPYAELHQMSLLERNRFIRALLWRLPPSKVAWAIGYKILGWQDEMRDVLMP